MRRLTAFLLAFATALIMPMGIDTAQTPPPASGDWEISDYTYIADSEVILNGNLTVKSGGKLELDNTILRMNCTTDGQYAIRVEKNGELVIKNGSLLTDWLTLYELGHYFKFVVWGKMAIQDSHIWRTTQNYYPGSIGIEINSDDVSIVNSSMEGHCEIGILINESNMQFLGSQTWRNKVGIYCRGFSHPTIADGWINGNEIGILVNDYSTPSIINNSFYNINISIANRMASFAFIERNFFSSQFGRGGIGISNEHFSSALVKNNTISNLTTGISNSNMSRPKITGNHIVGYFRS